MSITAILLFLMVLVFFIVGVAGIFLPVIPSLPVVWCGILLYAIFTNFTEVTVGVVLITFALMFIGTVVDLIASSWGARRYGASWIGVAGSLVGSIVGMIIFNIIGLIIGAFIGAFLGEFIFYKKAHVAFHAGIGTVIGFLFGVVIKIFIACVMFGIFILALL